MDEPFGNDPATREEFERRADLITAQQQVVVDLLGELHDRPEQQIAPEIIRRFADAGLPAMPQQWVQMVAAEIAADRLYVVAPGSTDEQAFTNDAADRARQRIEQDSPDARQPTAPSPTSAA